MGGGSRRSGTGSRQWDLRLSWAPPSLRYGGGSFTEEPSSSWLWKKGASISLHPILQVRKLRLKCSHNLPKATQTQTCEGATVYPSTYSLSSTSKQEVMEEKEKEGGGASQYFSSQGKPCWLE